MPTIHVIAGPNGVGKTTFADRYLPQTIRELEFVNADLIARGFSPYAPEMAATEAGRAVLLRVRHLIAEGRSFTWETTMSGRTAKHWLESAKQSGYRIKCYFLWVSDVETTLRRIRQRVSEGGHNISLDVARRRFFKTVENLFHIYLPLLDVCKLYVNDRETPRLIAVGKDGRFVIRDRKVFDRIAAEIGIQL